MQKSDIPFGSEFSPTIVDFSQLLQLVSVHEGDLSALQSAIRQTWFETRQTSEHNKQTLSMNVRLGMQKYELIDSVGNFTELGRRLLNSVTPEERLDLFGRHILLNLNGANLVQTVLQMQAAGETITLLSLRPALEIRGIHTSSANKSISIMRLWLQECGVFSEHYRVNMKRYESLIGISADEVEALSSLPRPLSAYLRALASLVEPGPFKSIEVRRLAEESFGGRYNEKQFARDVLRPLEAAGYVSTVRSGGRAKAFTVTATNKLSSEVTLPLLSQFDVKMTPGLSAMLKRPLPEIMLELASSDKHVKGLALEALAFRLMWIVGLNYLGTRLTGDRTSGAEVDLMFDSAFPIYSRWQVQCKNTSDVSLEDVAKEVGLAQYLRTNAIVIVTTGKIGRSARRYADNIMRNTNLAILMIEGKDIQAVLKSPVEMVNILDREAESARRLKPLDLDISED
jgi:site-specific DNA-methyltransferase (cytosine-N4-specific)